MKLSDNKQEFQELITLTVRWRKIPEDAVRKDYFIIVMLRQLEESKYADCCVFKGGTSLSKAYPDSIERFSEDIDLTYIPNEELTNSAGGGSNLAGLIAPFVEDKIKQRKNPEIIAVEPSSCPSLTKGEFRYDFCDTGEITPMAKMYTLGSDFIPPSSHSGGLRYHGMSPLVSQLYHDNYLKAVSYPQRKIFEAAVSFAKCETIYSSSRAARGQRRHRPYRGTP